MVPKTFHGQTINGKQWHQMASMFVDAINQGAVPNIHSSWQYICRQSCQQVLEKCSEILDQDISDLSLPSGDIDTTLRDI